MSKSTKPENNTSTPTVEKNSVEKNSSVVSEGDKELDAIFGARMRQRVILVDQEEEEEEEVQESSTSNKPSKSNRKRNKKNYASKGRNTFNEY